MPMSKCQDVIERISAIIDGDAGVMAKGRFHAHIAMCDSCRTDYQQMLTVRGAVGEVAASDLPTDFGDVMDFVLAGTTPADPE